MRACRVRTRTAVHRVVGPGTNMELKNCMGKHNSRVLHMYNKAQYVYGEILYMYGAAPYGAIGAIM